MAEAKEETNEATAEAKEQIMRKLAEVKEGMGEVAVKKLIVMHLIDLQEKETGGDDFLFWMEANGIESAQRVNALNAKLCTFRGECGKFAVEWSLNKVYAGAGAEVDVEALVEELGLFSEECGVLLDEFAKSVAELCIKKMRYGALVEKRHKRTILKNEINEARRTRKELVDRFAAFRRNLLIIRKQQDSQAHVIVQENDVGGALDKSTEIARGKFKNMERALSDYKVRNIRGVKSSAFTSESSRVLVEMMKGAKIGVQLVSRLDDAMALARTWTDAVIGKCIMKVWVGVLLDKHSVFEILKREIGENWKMEKEVKDKLIIYQRKHAHLAEGSATDIVEEGITKLGAHVEGDETIKEKNSGVGTVFEGDETIEEKNSTAVGGDETIEEKNSTVVGGDETIKEKNSGVGTVFEGDETIEEKNSTVVGGDDTIEEKNSTVVGGDETIKEKNSGVGTVFQGDETIEEKNSTVVGGDETIKVKNSGVGTVVGGDETIEEKNSGVGTVVEGDETIEEKNSTVVGGDETIEVKNSGVGTVVEGDETIEVKKSEGGTLGEGDLTKHPIDYHGLVWKKVGLFAAVGMIAALAELAMGKAKKSIATMSGGEEDTEAKEEVTELRMCRLAKLKEHIGVVSLKRLFNQEDDSCVGEGNQSRRVRKWLSPHQGLIGIFFLLVALLLVWFH